MTPTISKTKKSVSFAAQSKNASKSTKSTTKTRGTTKLTSGSGGISKFSGSGKRLGSSVPKSKRKTQKHKDSVLQTAVDASTDSSFLQVLHTSLNIKEIQKERKKEHVIKTKEANQELLKQLDDISNFSL